MERVELQPAPAGNHHDRVRGRRHPVEWDLYGRMVILHGIHTGWLWPTDN